MLAMSSYTMHVVVPYGDYRFEFTIDTRDPVYRDAEIDAAFAAIAAVIARFEQFAGEKSAEQQAVREIVQLNAESEDE